MYDPRHDKDRDLSAAQVHNQAKEILFQLDVYDQGHTDHTGDLRKAVNTLLKGSEWKRECTCGFSEVDGKKGQMGWTKNYQTKRRVVSAAQWRPEHPDDVAALLAENGMACRTCDLYGEPRIEIHDPESGFTHAGIGPGTWLVVDDGELSTYGPDQFIELFEARNLREGG